MQKDIEDRADIDLLMERFYSRAMSDDAIGHIFNDVARLDLVKHLPVIGDFWETILFQNSVYSKHGRNPLQVHGELAAKTPLLLHHFVRWLELFTETVDENFAGERADFLKFRARAIANRMLEFVSGAGTAAAVNADAAAAAEGRR